MASRFTRDEDGDGIPDDRETRTATQTRVAEPAPGESTAATRGAGAASAGAVGADTMRGIRMRQREEHGGLNWGAAFFGWLVAVGLAALLTGLLAGAGAAIGLTEEVEVSAADADELSIGGAIALLAVLAIAYFCGGYVAGRMSRFDGARQGVATWVVGLLITAALVVLAIVAGSEYNVLERLNLPSLPIDEQQWATGGLIATAIALVVTLVAAVLGGKAGERYHRRIDRTAVTY